jgi:hypothetical protein
VKIEFENARQLSRKAFKTLVFAVVTKYDEFIGRGGRDASGEIKRLEQDGAIRDCRHKGSDI